MKLKEQIAEYLNIDTDQITFTGDTYQNIVWFSCRDFGHLWTCETKYNGKQLKKNSVLQYDADR